MQCGDLCHKSVPLSPALYQGTTLRLRSGRAFSRADKLPYFCHPERSARPVFPTALFAVGRARSRGTCFFCRPYGTRTPIFNPTQHSASLRAGLNSFVPLRGTLTFAGRAPILKERSWLVGQKYFSVPKP